MSPAGDEDLRRLFEERRASDEEQAPPFRDILARRRPVAPAARVRPARLAVASAAILAVAVASSLLHRRPQPGIDIGEWKAPTDFLLEASYQELFDTTPALPEAVPDYAPLLAKEKGTKS